jgi:uncharacterized LabA/DUF88 family protein
MAQRVLAPTNQIVLLKYFTAKVKPTLVDPDVAIRQQVYLRAIKAYDPALEIIYGRFFEVDASVSVTKSGRTQIYHGTKSVEKGTDVSLAVHLLNDAWLNLYDVAVVVSNDTDLAEGIRLAQMSCKKIVGLIAPLLNNQKNGTPRRMSNVLRHTTDFQREIRPIALAQCQLPDTVMDGATALRKPSTW